MVRRVLNMHNLVGPVLGSGSSSEASASNPSLQGGCLHVPAP